MYLCLIRNFRLDSFLSELSRLELFVVSVTFQLKKHRISKNEFILLNFKFSNSFGNYNGKFCDNSTEILTTCSGFGSKRNPTKIKSMVSIFGLFYICWNWFFYIVNYNLLPFYDKAFHKSHHFSYYGHGYFLDLLFGLFWTFIYTISSKQ